MNTKKSEAQIENNIDIIIKILTNIFKFLPIFLLVWILYQFINLIRIDKLMYFSWTQVINDTVSLFFPVIFWVVWIYIWFFINEEKFKKFFIDSILNWLIILVISLILYWYGLKMLYSPLSFWFISVFMWKLIIIMKMYTGSENIKSLNYRNTLKILFTLISVIWIFNIIINLNYKDIYLKINIKEEKVVYMNDKYIILEKKVIHNSENVIFYYK